MKVTLFVPCFVDQYYPKAALGVVTVLERLGHTVEVPSGQTCCGQPAFNSGFWNEARSVAVRSFALFAKADAVVAPSGSCGAMLKVFYPQLFAGQPEEADALDLAGRVFEFSDFLVNRLGVTDVGAKLHARATFHDGCHGLRELGIRDAPRQLLAKVEGLELVEMSEAQTCCGFGGTFAVKFPSISTAMGEVKCDSIRETGASIVISNDSSCLMHLQGLLDRRGQPTRSLHLAEVLAGETTS
ncbi:MAG: (Fe-S)-binding protein [Candidatus Methylacidiphilales bacterium]